MIKIGIDVCGVLMNWLRSLELIYRRELPDKWIDFPPTNYDVSKFVEIGDAIYQRAYNGWAHELYSQAPAYHGAQIFMERLYSLAKSRNWWVKIVTYQPNQKTINLTARWLNKQEFMSDTVVFVKQNDKSRCDIDVLLDDNPAVLRSAERAGIRAIALDRPVNRDYNGERAECYDHFLAKMEEYRK